MKLFLSIAVLPLILFGVNEQRNRAQGEGTIADNAMTLLKFVKMEYPKRAGQALIQGIVVVQVRLDENGDVVDATALSGEELLISESLENARKWRFKPNAQRAAVIVYNFRMNETVSKPGCNDFVVEPPNFATVTMCPHEIQ